MAAKQFDLIVIGGGSGGVRTARKAVEQGASVALFECGRLGGTCVNVGCVPKKILSYAAHAPEDMQVAAGHGWRSSQLGALDWPALRDAMAAHISDLNDIYSTTLQNAGVSVFRERVRLAGPQAVEAASGRYGAETILIATGAHPAVPPIDGMREHAKTSDDMFTLPALPQTAIVAGAGYIAVEFACILAGLGASVTLVHRGDTILKNFDSSVQRHLLEELASRSVQLRLGETFTQVAREGDSIAAKLASGDVLHADLLLAATGRIPNTEGLGLAEAGVELGNKGEIRVNEHYCTSVPSIYALGDVIGRLALTPVAIAESMLFVAQRYGGYGPPIDYGLVPTVVFSHPNVGAIGLTEQQARKQHPDCVVADTEFTPLRFRLPGIGGKTYMKLIHLPDNGQVLGAHMVGPDAGETMQGFAVAMLKGATKFEFDETVCIHPSSAEEFVSMR